MIKVAVATVSPNERAPQTSAAFSCCRLGRPHGSLPVSLAGRCVVWALCSDRPDRFDSRDGAGDAEENGVLWSDRTRRFAHSSGITVV